MNKIQFRITMLALVMLVIANPGRIFGVDKLYDAAAKWAYAYERCGYYKVDIGEYEGEEEDDASDGVRPENSGNAGGKALSATDIYKRAWSRVLRVPVTRGAHNDAASDECAITRYWEDAQDVLVAVCSGDSDDVALVHRVMEGGARVDVVNEAGNTPLHLAVARGNVKIVRTLLEEYDAEYGVVNEQEYAALDLAHKKFGHRDITKYLALETVISDHMRKPDRVCKTEKRGHADVVWEHLFGA